MNLYNILLDIFMEILIFVRFLISVNSMSEIFRSPYFILQQFNVSRKKINCIQYIKIHDIHHETAVKKSRKEEKFLILK